MAKLIINRFDSRCAACGKGADPFETTHNSIVTYGSLNGLPGCGAYFTHVTSHYIGMRDVVQSLRPDLEWIDVGEDEE